MRHTLRLLLCTVPVLPFLCLGPALPGQSTIDPPRIFRQWPGVFAAGTFQGFVTGEFNGDREGDIVVRRDGKAFLCADPFAWESFVQFGSLGSITDIAVLEGASGTVDSLLAAANGGLYVGAFTYQTGFAWASVTTPMSWGSLVMLSATKTPTIHVIGALESDRRKVRIGARAGGVVLIPSGTFTAGEDVVALAMLDWAGSALPELAVLQQSRVDIVDMRGHVVESIIFGNSTERAAMAALADLAGTAKHLATLRWNASTSQWRVRVDAAGAQNIEDFTPGLPPGVPADFELAVRGLAAGNLGGGGEELLITPKIAADPFLLLHSGDSQDPYDAGEVYVVNASGSGAPTDVGAVFADLNNTDRANIVVPRVATDGILCIWGIPIPIWGTGLPLPSGDDSDYPVILPEGQGFRSLLNFDGNGQWTLRLKMEVPQGRWGFPIWGIQVVTYYFDKDGGGDVEVDGVSHVYDLTEGQGPLQHKVIAYVPLNPPNTFSGATGEEWQLQDHYFVQIRFLADPGSDEQVSPIYMMGMAADHAADYGTVMEYLRSISVPLEFERTVNGGGAVVSASGIKTRQLHTPFPSDGVPRPGPETTSTWTQWW